MSTSPKPIAECADRLAALYWHRLILRSVIVAFMFAGFVILGIRLNQPWIGALGVLAAAGIIILQILRQHHFLRALQCPDCNKPAGSYRSHSSRIYLHCEHCG